MREILRPTTARRVTIETKVWERDWAARLHSSGFSLVYELNEIKCHRLLWINNVLNPALVKDASEHWIRQGQLDVVEEVLPRLSSALNHFGLAESDLGLGLYYSSAELVGVFTCETEYLCHFAGDCRLAHKSDWIERGIAMLEARPDICVVNPIWNGNVEEAMSEAQSWDDDYAYGYGFSDQCYLIRTGELRNADLRTMHPESERYPTYGGDLFEKRVDSWMRANGLKRATDLRTCYVHLGHSA
jgi:hypothetical protein